MLLKLIDLTGRSRRQGVLMVDGGYEEITDLDLKIDWNGAREPSSTWIGVRTAERTAIIEAVPITTVPLRNRRKIEQGFLASRILECQSRFRWGARTGVGMVEFIERVEDGIAVAYPL